MVQKKVQPTTTPAKLARIRLLLSEGGYQIFSVHEKYRRSPDDFVAIHRDFDHLIMVRPGKNGIELRRRHDPIPVTKVASRLRSDLATNVRQRHLLPAVDFDEWWQWIDSSQYDGFQEALKQSTRYWRKGEQRSVRGRKRRVS